MADAIETDLIVHAIAEGFDKIKSDIGGAGDASEKAAKKGSGFDVTLKSIHNTANNLKQALGGAKIALAFIEQGFTFAAQEAEKLGRVDVTTNIDEAKNALSGLADVLVRIPIGGKDFLQWMGDGAAGIANLAKTIGALEVQLQLTLGIISRETAVQQINSLVTDEAAEKAKKDTAAKEQQKAAAQELSSELAVYQTVLANAVGNEMTSFSDKQQSLTEKMDENKAALEKLQAAQGQTVTVNHEATGSAAELFVAQDKLLSLSYQLGDAQQKLSEQTDPDKQHQAAVKAAELQVSYDQAKGAVENLGGSTATFVVNNSKQIDELVKKQHELQAAYDLNAAEHEKATNRILLDYAKQALAADGTVSPEDLAVLASLAEKFGLVDQGTAAAIAGIGNLSKEFDAKLISADEYTAGVQRIADILLTPVPAGIDTTIGRLTALGVITTSNTVPAVQKHIDIYTGLQETTDKTIKKHDNLYNSLSGLNYMLGTAADSAARLNGNLDGTPSSLGGGGGGGGSATGGAVPTKKAGGGPFMAGGAYIINDSPATTPEVPVVSAGGGGYVLTKQDAQQALAMAAGGGVGGPQVNVNVYPSGPVDYELLAQRVIALLKV